MTMPTIRSEDVRTPLDSHALEQLREFLLARDIIDAAQERKRKARDALVAYLASREANVGTMNVAVGLGTTGDPVMDERPVVRLIEYTAEVLDSARLKDEEPYTWRRFATLKRREELRLIGRVGREA